MCVTLLAMHRQVQRGEYSVEDSQAVLELLVDEWLSEDGQGDRGGRRPSITG